MDITQENATVANSREGVLPGRNYSEWQVFVVTDDSIIDGSYSLN